MPWTTLLKGGGGVRKSHESDDTASTSVTQRRETPFSTWHVFAGATLSKMPTRKNRLTARAHAGFGSSFQIQCPPRRLISRLAHIPSRLCSFLIDPPRLLMPSNIVLTLQLLT